MVPRESQWRFRIPARKLPTFNWNHLVALEYRTEEGREGKTGRETERQRETRLLKPTDAQ